MASMDEMVEVVNGGKGCYRMTFICLAASNQSSAYQDTSVESMDSAQTVL